MGSRQNRGVGVGASVLDVMNTDDSLQMFKEERKKLVSSRRGNRSQEDVFI